ncbi:hypothetical protein CAPTEDRAFT_203772 [Capitella teleta]|uniref:VWFD domain-containing protein n=1 Tax=Capitella teleta TaxID=283909 RepID=R7TF74_CAPTE|nr:hypothetical protein CAPTEDRAFT_203772 [Capitella teleta]|eukprot:ELT92408.1 hypothetical protein CAPTEDRAFT_203772 [Capitella teleta]
MFNSDVDMLIRGSCFHVLMSNRCPGSADGTFKLVGTFEHAKPTLDRSFVKEMSLAFQLFDEREATSLFEQCPKIILTNKGSGHVVELTETSTGTHGSRACTPFPCPTTAESGVTGILLSQESNNDTKSFTISEGLQITWDCLNMAQISLGKDFAGSVCGLCGDLIIGRTSRFIAPR